MTRQRSLISRALTLSSLFVIALAACGGSDEADSSSSDPDTSLSDPNTTDVIAGSPIPSARCEANKKAGTITYLSSFDFAASASIVEVLVAKEKGYFADLCLDVAVKASFSTANYPIVGANQAQFSSGGSFSEVVDFATKNEADLVVVVEEGKTGIDALITKPDAGTDLVAAVKGNTIGVKGKITPSVQAMLAKNGLIIDKDYRTVDIAAQYGFDPVAHIKIDGIVGFPGYKSNEPGQLERQIIDFGLFDPSEQGIPGSFGIIYTNAEFINAHPTAAQDFVRAAMKGLEDALADPKAAAAIANTMIEANGNPNFLSPEGEQFRWETEAKLLAEFTPAGEPIGVPDAAGLTREVTTYAEVGVFGEGAATPSLDGRIDTELISGVYGVDGRVAWPSK